MAATKGVGKLRGVLDFWACETCLKKPSREQDYFCGVCKRLQRDVAIQPRPIAPMRVRGTRTDAIRVVPPDEWEAATRAKDGAVEGELELARLQQREDDLQGQIHGLEAELDRLRSMEAQPVDAKRRVRFELVGVRRPEEEVEFQEEFEDVTDGELSVEPSATEPDLGILEGEEVPSEAVSLGKGPKKATPKHRRKAGGKRR